MSRYTAMTVMEQLFGKPALIHPHYATASPEVASKTGIEIGLMGALRALAVVDVDQEERQAEQRKYLLASAYMPGALSQQDKPFAFADGKAIIPVHGVLVNRLPYSFGFATGYSFIRNQVNAAMDDPQVDGIIYDVNSYGGLVSGCEETSDLMYQANGANGGKPSMAVVDSNCYSAAYMLASAADKLVSTPTGGAGSIGVVMMHADLSKMLDDVGVKVSFIHAGKYKVEGNPYEPLSEEATSHLQGEVNKIYDRFVATVSRNRPGMSEQAARDTEARCFQADDALEVGLIDAVQSPPAAIRSFTQAEEDTEMADKKESEPQVEVKSGPSQEQIATEARAAERTRIRAIQGSEEAQGREELAAHLVDVGMDAEQAVAILKVAPKKAAAATNPPAQTEQNHFKNAMNAGGQPNVGSNPEGAADGEDKPSAAQRILANQKKVTGYGGVRGENESNERVRRVN